ncbi:hypothetical protein Tco_1396722, partial [Tanacetum coccineum]
DAMIRIRSEAPSTYHSPPLHIILSHTRADTPPSGTPPLLPIPAPTSSPSLLLPYADHGADKPEVCLPPRKRLCFAFGPRYEVRESSSAPLLDLLEAMIDQGIISALAARNADKNTNGDDSHNSGTGVKRTEQTTRECTYTDFLKCQPLNFTVIEGVTGLSQWFERMESIFHINNCTVENQVKFATCSLHSVALTWWNTHVKTVGHDAAYESDKIEKYVGGLPDMIHGSVVTSKPKTMQEAVEIATELIDKKICTFAVRQTESKRKQDDNQQQQQQQQNKRQNTSRAYTA